ELDDPLLTEPRNRLGKTGVGEALGIDQLSDDAMDEDLVGIREAGCGAGADGLDRGRRHSGLHRERRMRVPFVAGAQMTRGQANREFRRGRRQRAAPAQIFAEPLQMVAYLRRTNQDLEWTA